MSKVNRLLIEYLAEHATDEELVEYEKAFLSEQRLHEFKLHELDRKREEIIRMSKEWDRDIQEVNREIEKVKKENSAILQIFKVFMVSQSIELQTKDMLKKIIAIQDLRSSEIDSYVRKYRRGEK